MNKKEKEICNRYSQPYGKMESKFLIESRAILIISFHVSPFSASSFFFLSLLCQCSLSQYLFAHFYWREQLYALHRVHRHTETTIKYSERTVQMDGVNAIAINNEQPVFHKWICQVVNVIYGFSAFWVWVMCMCTQQATATQRRFFDLYR